MPPDRGLRVASGGPVDLLVERRELYGEPRPEQEPAKANTERRGPAGKLAGNVNRGVFLLNGPISREVLSLQVGVDRHRGDAASTDGRHEVYGCRPTSPPDLGQRLFGYQDVHGPTRT